MIKTRAKIKIKTHKTKTKFYLFEKTALAWVLWKAEP